jgi:hypothetical protein
MGKRSSGQLWLILLTRWPLHGDSLRVRMFVNAHLKRAAAAPMRALRVVCWWPALMNKRRHGGWASMAR